MQLFLLVALEPLALPSPSRNEDKKAAEAQQAIIEDEPISEEEERIVIDTPNDVEEQSFNNDEPVEETINEEVEA